MKRIAAFILLLALLPVTASAYNPPEPVTAEELPEYVTNFINTYNSYAETFAVQPLTFDGWQDTGVNYKLSIGEASISFDNMDGKCFATIIIPLQNANLDFLAECACLSLSVAIPRIITPIS